MEREAGRVFKGWKEGKIFFAPTYKYAFNSDTYYVEGVKVSKNKRRTPAWYVLMSVSRISDKIFSLIKYTISP